MNKAGQVRLYLVLTIVFLAITILLSFGSVVLSCSQIGDTVVTPGGSTIYNRKLRDDETDACSTDPILDQFRPSAFYFNNDETALLGCGWSATNSALRIVFAFLVIGVVIASFVFSIAMRSPWSYLFALILIIFAGVFGFLTYLDANDITESRKWCRENLTGIHFYTMPDVIDCTYYIYDFVATIDAFLLVFILLTVSFELAYKIHAGPKSLKKDSGGVDFESPSRDIGPQRDEEEDSNRGGKTSSSNGVDFEQEQSRRFAPISKTDAEANNRNGSQQASSSSRKSVVKPGEFDFEAEAEKNPSAKYDDNDLPLEPVHRAPPPRPSNKPPPPPPSHSASHNNTSRRSVPAHAPPREPPPRDAPAQNVNNNQNQMIDFEALAED